MPSTPKITDLEGSLNGNTIKANEFASETSADELDLLGTSSSKGDNGPATPRGSTPSTAGKGTPRQFMDGVVISTPKSFLRTPQKFPRFVPGSPSPSRPAGRTRVAKLPTGKPLHLSPRSSKKSALPATDRPLFPAEEVSRSTSPTSCKPAAGVQRLPRCLPSHLVPHLHSQRRKILQALQNPPLFEYKSSPYRLVFNQLKELVNGTTDRREGNSCMILGPRGAGKSRLIDGVLTLTASTSTNTPVIVRLSAYCQTNDRLAMREIARQIHQQTGSASLLPGGEDDLDSIINSDDVDLDLPPSSRLPGMIAALPRLGRPVIVVLDAFDGFAAHARQALLYCLLDTVQSCQGLGSTKPDQEAEVSPEDIMDDQEPEMIPSTPQSDEEDHSDAGVNTITQEHGLLVIGLTSRVDCLTLLEKRVKSRFSHRIMRVGTPPGLIDFLDILRIVLDVDVDEESENVEEWKTLWKLSVKEFFSDKCVLDVMNEVFALGKDLRGLFRLLIAPIISLTPASPWLTASQLITSISTQRSPKQFPFLTTLPYPHVALLIAAAHVQTAGHDTFNFETLHDKFTTQVRVSVSTPVQLERGGLSMVNVARGVMLGAFEHLVSNRVFQPVAAFATHVTKEFVKYRCVATREDIKRAVEQLGQTNLKKWFSRNQ